MKKLLIIGTVIIALLAIIGLQRKQIKNERFLKNIYILNSEILMKDIDAYKVNDSLNAISVGNLQFTISEFEKYRAEDAKIIAELNVDKKRLERITTTQLQTIYDLQGSFRDSIRAEYKDREIVKIDTLKCLEIRNYWFDLTGCIVGKNDFEGKFESREQLKYVEHIIPKKFLFIKWGQKERKQDIVSMNPYSRIIDAEFITIRK